MGYIVDISGELELKDKTIKTIKQLVDKIKKYKDIDEDSSGFLDLIDYREVATIDEGDILVYYNENYNDHDWYEFLDAIKEEVVIGSQIECDGDDNEHWRWELKEDGWYEQKGTIVYNEGFKI